MIGEKFSFPSSVFTDLDAIESYNNAYTGIQYHGQSGIFFLEKFPIESVSLQ